MYAVYLSFGFFLLFTHFALLKVVHISTRLALLIPALPPCSIWKFVNLSVCPSGSPSFSQPLQAVSQIVAFDDAR